VSNEITIGYTFSVNNGGYSSQKSESLSVGQTTSGAEKSIISIGTSEGDLSFPNIATLGFCRMKNLDATNFITIGPKSAGAMVGYQKIKAGEAAVLRLLPGITLRAKADTAAVKLEIEVLND
jgi:hypothetical protein